MPDEEECFLPAKVEKAFRAGEKVTVTTEDELVSSVIVLCRLVSGVLCKYRPLCIVGPFACWVVHPW
jgi:hypothetical protein